jgi:hypothetical protein
MASIFFAAARQGAHYATFPALISGCLVTLHQQESSNRGNLYSHCESSFSSSSTPFFQNKHQGKSANFLKRRMSPVGRFSVLSETKTNPSIPVLVLAFTGEPLSSQNFLELYRDRKVDEKHERFRSVTQDLNHFFALPKEKFEPQISERLSYPVVYRTELKKWIADALLEPLDLSQSLWQTKIATGGTIGQSGAFPKRHLSDKNEGVGDKVESLIVFRAHHCMADGVSLGTIFSDLMDESEEFQQLVTTKIKQFKKRKKSLLRNLFVFAYYWCWGSVKAFAYQLQLYLSNWKTLLYNSNPWKLLQKHQLHTDDDDSASRTLSWISVTSVDEVKQVAEYFSSKRSKITVNDIFCSCVSAAIAKLMIYHQNRRPDLSLQLPYMNLVMPVHMQGGVLLPGQSMGNKIGAMISRIPGQKVQNGDNSPMDPAHRLNEVHEVLFSRKQTPAAIWGYLFAGFIGYMGYGNTKRLDCLEDGGGGVVPWMFEKSHANSDVVVTNVRGPEKIIHLDGRRLEAVIGFLPLPPGIPMGVVIQSYANKVNLTLNAEKYAVPDGDLFLSWVVQEYEALKKQANVGC